MPISQDLLDILACPGCDSRPPVRLAGEELVCGSCQRRYPIRNDIPVMLIEEGDKGRDAARARSGG